MGANHHVDVKQVRKRVSIKQTKERQLPITIRLDDRTSLDSYIQNFNLSENSPDKKLTKKNSIPVLRKQMIRKQSSNQSQQNYFTNEKVNRLQNIEEKDVHLQTWDSNTIIKKHQLKGGSPMKKITITSIMNEIQSNRVPKNGQFKQSLNHEDMRGFFYNHPQNKSKKDLKLIRLHSIKSNQFSRDNIKKITLPEIEQLARQSSSINLTCFPCYQAINNIFDNNDGNYSSDNPLR